MDCFVRILLFGLKSCILSTLHAFWRINFRSVKRRGDIANMFGFYFLFKNRILKKKLYLKLPQFFNNTT